MSQHCEDIIFPKLIHKFSEISAKHSNVGIKILMEMYSLKNNQENTEKGNLKES